MDDLLYLVAHAPTEPWDCFEPAVGPAPVAPPDLSDSVWGLDSREEESLRAWQRGENDDLKAEWARPYITAWTHYRKRLEEHKEEVDVQRRAQWPWWYARTVLAARPAEGPPRGHTSTQPYVGYLVICNDDEDQPLKRVLATRQVFPDYEQAKRYAGGVASGRNAEVIGCPQAFQIVRGK